MKLYFTSKKMPCLWTRWSNFRIISFTNWKCVSDRACCIDRNKWSKEAIASGEYAECKTSQPRFIMMSFVLEATCGLTLSRSNFTGRSPLHSIRAFSFQFLAQGRLIDVGTSQRSNCFTQFQQLIINHALDIPPNAEQNHLSEAFGLCDRCWGFAENRPYFLRFGLS